ncbi:ribonuclease 3 isoform 5 [Camelus ferus]|nr:ribonuclease 3 isoform 5 [Camelus ferus]
MPQQVNYQYPPGYSHHNFPPPNFNSFQNNSSSFPPSANNSSSPHFRHLPPYPLPKAPSERRSPERLKHYDDHRHRDHSHGRGERHRSLDRRERGRSPDRRRQDSRYRSDYDRGRTPSRHRSYERSSRSPSREKKRARWEEEKDRWSDNQSSGKEKNYTSIKEKEPEEVLPDKNEEEEEELLKPVWIRCTHSENYYSSDPMDQVGDSTVVGTSRLRDLYDKFEEELGSRQEKAKAARPPWEPPKTKLDEDLESSSESECESDEDSTCSSSSDSEVFDVIAEIKRKKAHPDRLHDELWYNDPGQAIKPCRPMTNNAGRLFHYRITVSPPTNFLTDRPTVIEYDDHEYIFEGFSMFAHAPLTNVNGGKEVLSMHQILLYLLRCSKALVPEEEIANMLQWEELEWQKYAEECKGMIVTNPGTKPSSVRIDQLDREQFNPDVITFPIIVHFGIRPAQLSYAGDPQYQKLWKSYVKLRHLLANSPKVKQTDKQKLAQREEALQKIRQKNTMRREVTVELSSQGFWKTGIRSDVCQHAMMLPVLTHHIRYHQCLMHLDKLIGYTFQDRCLLQAAPVPPAKAIRAADYEEINHNERLEFLGDAVVEFLTSVHLYYLFPSLEEGGLATYRTAIVQNQHLAMLAKLQEPNTDRQLIETSPVLQKLTEFEDAIGVIFTHVRLLARAFTLRTVGFNHLTLGHNQRMEFLGDSIMQLVATEYLFIHFPDHHEGHLTLLRSSLVNNRTQAKVAEELGMQEYAITNDKTKRPVALRTKTLADLLESFIAALYIDKDLEYVHTFMNVCFFPRLKEFILNQDWNDPKSQLQQCCLTLRTEGKEPDIPLYKTLQTVGPSHARTYTVAVYFKGERIGCGKGPRNSEAEVKRMTMAVSAPSLDLLHLDLAENPVLEPDSMSPGGSSRKQGSLASLVFP